MRKVLILLTILVVGAVVWWTITADERRVTECRDTGIRDLARLARCAKGPEERDEVFSEAREERQAEKRRLFRMRLAEVRSSNRSEVDKRQYKPVSFDDLLDAYGVDYPEHWYERAEIPAQTEERRFSVGGAILSGELPDAGSPEIYLSVSDTLRGAIKADIESLGRGEREFIWKVCASFYVRRVFDRMGCPVVAYGQVAFESLFDDDWLDPGLGVRNLFVPVFQIEAVDFLDPPQP